MRRALYCGTFDPPTVGHMHIIEKSARIFDHVEVAVLRNTAKKTMFTPETRLTMLRLAAARMANVSASYFDGLTAALARERGVQYLIRGVRPGDDFALEYTMAVVNKGQNPALETIFIVPDLPYSYISSGVARDLILHDGDLTAVLPPEILAFLQENKGRDGFTYGK